MKKYPAPLLLALVMATTCVVSACSKSPQETPTSPVASTAANNVSDLDVTENVKTRLQQNNALKGFDIQVITLKGDVRLMGAVMSQAQMDDAVDIARASNGVHSIHNELTIKK